MKTIYILVLTNKVSLTEVV